MLKALSVFGKKSKPELRLVLADSSPGVLAALGKLTVSHQIVGEALTTEGVYRTLERANLLIADLETLPESGGVGRAMLREVLRRTNIPSPTPAQFAADPVVWQEEALAAAGHFEHLPPKSVAFTSLSGGVGKTTLSLDTALAFAHTTRLPTLIVEFCHGASGLLAVTGAEAPSLYDCVRKEQPLAQWQGVNLLPMDFEYARQLSQEAILAYLRRQQQAHVLTVFDAEYFHVTTTLVESERLVDTWCVLCVPRRPDTVENARALAARLAEKNIPAQIILNQTRPGEGMLVASLDRALELGYDETARWLDGRLGRDALRLIYPGLPARRHGGILARLPFSRNGPGPAVSRQRSGVSGQASAVSRQVSAVSNQPADA